MKKYLLILPFFLLFNMSVVSASIWSDITEKDEGGLHTIGKDVFGDEEPEINIQQTVFKFLKYIFSFLGTVFIVLIIYGGFIYMTSMGDSDNVSKAKDIIINASIGLIIIVASYAITNFVIQAATKATGS